MKFGRGMFLAFLLVAVPMAATSSDASVVTDKAYYALSASPAMVVVANEPCMATTPALLREANVVEVSNAVAYGKDGLGESEVSSNLPDSAVSASNGNSRRHFTDADMAHLVDRKISGNSLGFEKEGRPISGFTST